MKRMRRMKRIKRYLSKLLVLTIASCLLVTAIGPLGTLAEDISSHWAAESINFLMELGIIKGDDNGDINPNNFITRAEFVTIINRAFGFTEKGELNFPDVKSNAWYYDDFAIAKNQGYIMGYEDGNANPGKPITRAEVAVIIARVLVVECKSTTSAFADNDSFPGWSAESIIALTESGFIEGYSDNTFRAGNNITRAEAFTILARIIKQGLISDTEKDEETVDDEETPQSGIIPSGSSSKNNNGEDTGSDDGNTGNLPDPEIPVKIALVIGSNAYNTPVDSKVKTAYKARIVHTDGVVYEVPVKQDFYSNFITYDGTNAATTSVGLYEYIIDDDNVYTFTRITASPGHPSIYVVDFGVSKIQNGKASITSSTVSPDVNYASSSTKFVVVNQKDSTGGTREFDGTVTTYIGTGRVPNFEPLSWTIAVSIGSDYYNSNNVADIVYILDYIIGATIDDYVFVLGTWTAVQGGRDYDVIINGAITKVMVKNAGYADMDSFAGKLCSPFMITSNGIVDTSTTVAMPIAAIGDTVSSYGDILFINGDYSGLLTDNTPVYTIKFPEGRPGDATVSTSSAINMNNIVTDTKNTVYAERDGGNVFAIYHIIIGNEQDIKIALITMDSIDQHWIEMNEGAQKAANELDITVTFMSPDFKDEAAQIEMIEKAVKEGYQAIVVAANGPDAISGALSAAVAAGIKLVYVDSLANVPAEAAFITDSRAAGRTAGEQMLEALMDSGKSSGKIGIVDVDASIDVFAQRNAGFREAFIGSGFTILETQFCDGDAGRAYSITENYITQSVVGIFGTNEGSLLGIGNALRESGNNTITGVGFDKSDAILELINDGWLYCTLVQNPEAMGYEGVKAAVVAIGGESLGGMICDTGVLIIYSKSENQPDLEHPIIPALVIGVDSYYDSIDSDYIARYIAVIVGIDGIIREVPTEQVFYDSFIAYNGANAATTSVGLYEYSIDNEGLYYFTKITASPGYPSDYAVDFGISEIVNGKVTLTSITEASPVKYANSSTKFVVVNQKNAEKAPALREFDGTITVYEGIGHTLSLDMLSWTIAISVKGTGDSANNIADIVYILDDVFGSIKNDYTFVIGHYTTISNVRYYYVINNGELTTIMVGSASYPEMDAASGTLYAELVIDSYGEITSKIEAKPIAVAGDTISVNSGILQVNGNFTAFLVYDVDTPVYTIKFPSGRPQDVRFSTSNASNINDITTGSGKTVYANISSDNDILAIYYIIEE